MAKGDVKSAFKLAPIRYEDFIAYEGMQAVAEDIGLPLSL